LEFLSHYWIIIVLVFWFLYKWWNSKKILDLLPTLRARGAYLVDVRSQNEFNAGHAPGTLNIPLHELTNRLSEIPKEAPIVLCCASGTRSGMARMLLKKNGYKEVYNIGTWSKFLGERI
jgi:phage shock protein E